MAGFLWIGIGAALLVVSLISGCVAEAIFYSKKRKMLNEAGKDYT